MKKKACRECKILVLKDVCPKCQNANFVTNWKGRIIVLDAAHSQVAQKMGLDEDNEYAIKVN